MKSKKILSVVLAIVLFGGGVFYIGFHAGTTANVVSPQFANAEGIKHPDLSLFWNVVSIIKDKHINGEALTDEKIVNGAIQGAIESLGDPYSNYFPPVDAEKFNEDLSGVFGGIGAEIGIRDNRLTIIAPLKGNPAEKVGLKAGDLITDIDATSTSGMGIDAAIKLIRGLEGTTVTLTIMRDEFKEPKKFTITRAVVSVPTLEWGMKEGNIAYFKLYNFNANLAPAWNIAATKAVLRSPKGIIIDVRNNPGGFLDVATDITGWFVKRGNVIVREKLRGGNEELIYATGNEAFSRVPIIVVVNEGSASASEILAGALRDLRGAKIVGEKTFGKGSVQEVQTLPSGGLIKISIAEWLTPNKSSINKLGIKPDVEIKLTEDDIKKKKDPQFDKALEILRAEMKKAR